MLRFARSLRLSVICFCFSHYHNASIWYSSRSGLFRFLNVLNFFLGKQISQTKKLNPAVLIILLVVAQILLAATGMIINICVNHGLNLCTTQNYCIISDYPFDFLLMVVLMAQFNMIGLYMGVVIEGLAKR